MGSKQGERLAWGVMHLLRVPKTEKPSLGWPAFLSRRKGRSSKWAVDTACDYAHGALVT